MLFQTSILKMLCAAVFFLASSESLSLPTHIRKVDGGEKGARQIALTFDADGEASSFPKLLQALSAAKIHCTFFVTGRWAQDHPQLVRQIALDGHEIGNLTWSHADLTQLANFAIVQEIERTDELLANLLGKKPARLFRAPFGRRNSRVLATVESLGFQDIYWDLDSLDSVGDTKSPRFLFDRITMKKDADLDGAIVLWHAGEPSTAIVIPYLIQALKARGFQLATVSQVIADRKNRQKRLTL